MNRDEVLAEMEADFAIMTEDDKSTVLFKHAGQEWTPAKLIAEVRENTPMGLQYVGRWSEAREHEASMKALLEALLGGPMPPGVHVDVIDLDMEDEEDELPPLPGFGSGRGESKPS